MKNRLLALIPVALIVSSIIAYSVISRPKDAPPQEVITPAQLPAATITYENNVFNPSVITIHAGEIVEFVNKSQGTLRITSNPHPYHTSYPELDSNNIQPNQRYRIIFPRAVVVNFHNHFNPGASGTINVK